MIDFSLCLFFTKLVSYTFLFWLPMYITHTSEWIHYYLWMPFVIFTDVIIVF